MVAVLSLFGGMYYLQHLRHQRRAAREPHQPGSLSACAYAYIRVLDQLMSCLGEYRMHAARTPSRDSASLRAGLVEPRATPLGGRVEPNRAQHRTMASIQDGSAPILAQNGSYLQPAPQRDRGDGLAYTKRVRLLDIE